MNTGGQVEYAVLEGKDTFIPVIIVDLGKPTEVTFTASLTFKDAGHAREFIASVYTILSAKQLKLEFDREGLS